MYIFRAPFTPIFQNRRKIRPIHDQQPVRTTALLFHCNVHKISSMVRRHFTLYSPEYYFPNHAGRGPPQ
ncbi:hypothetical protein BDZ97DRAFT_1821179 [Flammula alnicola]|nr:hypothetical protein BDZ97DRAFT_1821179 [Flammula alnicola]